MKVLQFGEGNFLRAFADYFFDKLNYKVAMIKNISSGDISQFAKQNNEYHVILEGKETEVRKIKSIEKVINIYSDYQSYIELAKLEDLQLIVSNTTEAGIVFNDKDSFSEKLNITYPAKLTQFLFERFKANKSGVYILPCELIDDNADNLLLCVKKYIKLWNLPNNFENYIGNECFFCNTLVDRIVSGFPKKDVEKYYNIVGCEDKLLVVAEPFGLWAIEEKGNLRKVLNAQNIPEILLTKDIKPYKIRKVRLLNGSHTALVPEAYLAGCETVAEAMNIPKFKQLVKTIMFDEVMPTINLDRTELESFANSVIERFENPYLNHSLLAISLNSISKFKARILPTVFDYIKIYGTFPKNLIGSLAYLIKMYKTCTVMKDDSFVLEFFANTKENLVEKTLRNEQFWGTDLTKIEGLLEFVKKTYERLS